MQADAEHQQDDPELGHLADGLVVLFGTAREGGQGDPRKQVAHDGRQAQAARDEPAGQGEG